MTGKAFSEFNHHIAGWFLLSIGILVMLSRSSPRSRGYMVTFRQTDPLFSFDLADPANPRMAGQIEVSGFATCIHLLGANSTRLLTIGRSADSSGRVTGNKLQLFDPHAFLYYEPTGILAIPNYTYHTGTNTASSGLNVFTVDAASISLRGTISAKTITTAYGSYADIVDRSVIIGDNIYSVAHRSVTVADPDLNVITTVDLPETYSTGIIGIEGGSGGTVAAAKGR